MKRCFHKVLIGLALLIVMGHTIIAHHHHDEIDVAIPDEHHDHDGDPHHGIFSFGQLDDDFVPSKVQHSLPDDISFIVAQVINQYSHEFLRTTDKPEQHFKNEFPPPDDQSYFFSRRGPPAA